MTKKAHPAGTGHGIKKNTSDNYYPEATKVKQPLDLYQYERNRQRSMRKIKRLRARRARG